jgi:glycine cleavage system transcriptional repressor
VGKDRPGIVDDVSTILFEQGANIEDSRMAVMGGCFSIMTLFSCTAEQLEAITRGFKGLERTGFEISFHEVDDPSFRPRRSELPLKIEVRAMDHPGIVKKVVHVLRHYDVNIESLNTRVIRAPLSGTPIFDLSLEAGIPVDKPIEKLKEELAELSEDLNLDLSFKE